jgi:hypothetical protein
MNALDDPAAFYRDHFREQGFGALGCGVAQVALATLRAYNHPCPGQAKAFRCGLVCLNLVLSYSCFTGHSYTPLRKNSAESDFIRG